MAEGSNRKTTAGGRPTGGRGSQGSAGGARSVPSLWPRRIVTGVLLLVVLGLLIAGVWHLLGVLTSAEGESEPGGSSGGQSGAAQSGSGASGGVSNAGGEGGATDPLDLEDDDGTSAVSISACTAQDLQATVTVGGLPTVGSGATVDLTLEGPTDRQCTTSVGQVGIRILSGDQTLFDSAACTSGQSGSTPLLLTPGSRWTGSIPWDGRTYDGCSPVDTDGDGQAQVAGAGTYRARAYLDGAALGPEVVFEVR